MNRRLIITLLLIVATLCASFYFIGLRKGREGANGGTQTKIDTLVIYKTKAVEMPQYKTLTFQRWAFFTDSVTTLKPYVVHDTVYVPISQKYYEELDGRLRIWVSGYQPNLDRYEIDEKTEVITRTVRKRWSLSVGAGPAVIYSPFTKRIDAGIGVYGGLTYSF